MTRLAVGWAAVLLGLLVVATWRAPVDPPGAWVVLAAAHTLDFGLAWWAGRRGKPRPRLRRIALAFGGASGAWLTFGLTMLVVDGQPVGLPSVAGTLFFLGVTDLALGWGAGVRVTAAA